MAEKVYVIEDDEDMRNTVGDLLASVGYEVELFCTANEFMDPAVDRTTGCLILDIRLPGLSGLDFQDRLVEERVSMPIIFMTGYGDIAMTVQAMKAGAHEFLTKPFRDQDLLDAVHSALERARAIRAANEVAASIEKSYESLSPREREIMALVVAGRLNKVIAGDLGLSEVTIKVHRRQIMQKMNARSLPELVRFAERLGVTQPLPVPAIPR